MEDTFEVILPRGRQFEQDVLGVHGESTVDDWPSYMNFEDSISFAARENWGNYSKSLRGEMEWHNPTRPTMGMTKEMWEAVDFYLASLGRGENGPLNLYISVGFNSLDYYHGVDAFFWWHGVVATIDLSLRNKWRDGTLKADFQVSMVDITKTNLDLFGEHVAHFLERERINQKLSDMERRRQALHKISDYIKWF